jgi:hypothetical protein
VLAVDILPIQGPTIPCERVFSSSAKTDDVGRNRTAPDLMEAFQMLKFSVKKGRRLKFAAGTSRDEEIALMEAETEERGLSRNQYASGDLGLPLGLWLFTCQAHVDVKRVLCRFGYSVSESTARNALNSLTNVDLSVLQEQVRDATARGEVEFGKISDNVRRYERVLEHGADVKGIGMSPQPVSNSPPFTS